MKDNTTHLKMTHTVIGLTGGIGSGKTAVSDWFANQGIDVVDADVISRAITAKGSPTLQVLKEHFGAWIIDDKGELDRVALRQYVFDNPTALSQLNAITHPAIRTQIINSLRRASSDYVILSVPLLFEGIKGEDKGLIALCQRVLVVDVPPDIQRVRASQRDGKSHAQIQAIIDNQIDRTTRLSLADDVVDNSQDLPHLYRQLPPLHQKYLKLAQQKRP